MSTKCVTREVVADYARPPCFTSGYADGGCYGSTAFTECGVILSDSSSAEIATVAAFHGFADVLSEEDAFRYFCAEGVAEQEIASRTGIYDLIVDLIFGREELEGNIRHCELSHAKYNFEHFYREGRYDGLDLNAIRNRASQFVEQIQVSTEKFAQLPLEAEDCNNAPFGTNMHCDHVNYGMTLFDSCEGRRCSDYNYEE